MGPRGLCNSEEVEKWLQGIAGSAEIPDSGGERMSVLRFLPLVAGWFVMCPIEAQDNAVADPWKRSGSPETYLHHIELRDSQGQVISATENSGQIPDMGATCAPCHDVDRASGGLHGGEGPNGSTGEPWFLTDSRSGTRWPFHSRLWPGMSSAEDLGLDQGDLQKRHGAFDPGGHHSFSGQSSDCLICHLRGSYNFEQRTDLIQAGKPDLAPFVAAGLIDESAALVSGRFDHQEKVTLDLRGDAGQEACLHCHSVTSAAVSDQRPRWAHAQDVHLAAGMSCVDCHRAGLDHHVVRGKDGEIHPSGVSVESLSCRGCHLPSGEPVMHSAPRPEHRGLPHFHLEAMTCTACHSGALQGEEGELIWTSRAHQLGIARQGRIATDPPAIHSGILLKDDQDRWAPHYQAWPEGWMHLSTEDQAAAVIPPADLRTPLRRTLRVRGNLLEKIAGTVEDPGRAERSLSAFLGQLDSPTALVTSGHAWQRSPGDQLKPVSHELAKPIQWKVGHPVRPASMSLGSNGCNDCHAPEESWPLLVSKPASLIPLAAADTVSVADHSDPRAITTFESPLWNFWKWIFPNRDLAKIYFAGCGILALIASMRLFLKAMEGSRS